MDKDLFTALRKGMRGFNPVVANGFATTQIPYAEQYINEIMECAARGFPPGLVYCGMYRCTPTEEYAEVTAKRNTRHSFEIARSDVYLVRFKFEYHGHPIVRYVYMPYVRDAGLISVRGKIFGISPIMADKTMSVGVNSIFVLLNLAKLNFNRQIQHFYKDGARETVYVVWSEIYRDSKKPAVLPDVRGNTTLIHYLFCKYGVSKTFSDYAGCPVIIADIDEIQAKLPEGDWVICQSSGIRPKEVMRRDYIASRAALAVPRAQYTPLVANLIGGFFNVADLFPIEVVPDPEYYDNVDLWKCLLGRLLISEYTSEGVLMDRIAKHLVSLDGYLDDMRKEMFRDDGIFCNDIYDFFAYIVEHFNEKVMQFGNMAGSLYGKRLTVLHYVLFDIVSQINGIKFALQPDGKKEFTLKDVEARLSKLDRELILKLNGPRHGEVSSVSCSGDNKVFKITSHVVMQTNSTGGKRGKAKPGDPTKLLDVSIAEFCCYNSTAKSDPSSRNRLNPFALTSHSGELVRDEAVRDLTDRTQQLIKMK